MRIRTILTSAHLAATVEDAFDYVTTAGNWPSWHPSSIAVRGVISVPAGLGDEIVEDFRVAGRTGTAVWTVVSCEPPHRWVIDGTIVGRSMGGAVTYELAGVGTGTAFQRLFSYPVPWRFALAEQLLIRSRVQAESEEGTRRLVEIFDAGASR